MCVGSIGSRRICSSRDKIGVDFVVAHLGINSYGKNGSKLIYICICYDLNGAHVSEK